MAQELMTAAAHVRMASAYATIAIEHCEAAMPGTADLPQEMLKLSRARTQLLEVQRLLEDLAPTAAPALTP